MYSERGRSRLLRNAGNRLEGKVKVKAIPLQAWTGPEGSRRLRLPDLNNRLIKVVRLSALRIGRLYPQENIPGNHFR